MERRPDLITKFDSIDLGAMRQKVKAMRLGFENWKHLASLLALELYQPSQGNLLDVGEMA
jgi:hypothetical protein